SWLDLSSVRMAVPEAAFGGPPAAPLPRHPAPLAASEAPPPPPGTRAAGQNMQGGSPLRGYQGIPPAQPPGPRLPAIVFLHGVNSDIGGEEARDGLLPLASQGRAVLVYPVGYAQSWNAGVCCGAAVQHDVDDVAFLAAVAERLAGDPGVD